MVGGRTRYEYPYGKPAGLGYLEIVGFLIVICFVLFASRGPVWTAATIAAFVGFGIAHSRLLTAYEKDGLAVRIPRNVTVVRFLTRKPLILVVLGYSSIVLIALLFLFCFASFPRAVTDAGIIGAGICLIAFAICYKVIERKYVKTGQAVKVETEQ